MKYFTGILVLIGLLTGCFGQEIEISVATTDQVNPAIASDGTDYVVIWEDNRAGTSNKNILGHPIYGDGELPMSFFAISNEDGNQTQPAIEAIDADTYLMVWSEPGSDIKGRLATFTAVASGPNRIISTSAQTSNINLASSESGFFCVWEEDNTVKAVPIDPSGSTSIPAITIYATSDEQSNPDVAYYDGKYLTVWAQEGSSSGIYARKFYDDGIPEDEQFAIDNESAEASTPAVATSGTGALVVYEVEGPSDQDIMGRIVNEGMESTPFIICSGIGVQQNPVVAFGNGVYLVVYEDFGDGYFANIMGQWVSSAGTPIGEAFVISAESAAQNNPQVSFASESFLVTWDDRRRGGADIFGKIVTTSSLPGGPVSSVIYPLPDRYLSFSDVDLKIYLYDPDGVDESTIELLVGTTSWTLSSAELTYSNDTLTLSGAISGSDGEIIECSLSGVQDLLGNHMAGSLNWNIVFDQSSPDFTAPTPPNESTQPMLPSMITLNISDAYSGIDPYSIHVETHEVDLTFPDPALYWNDLTFALLTDSLELSREYYTNDICVSAADMPTYGEANTDTFCWRFYNMNDIKEVKPVEYAMDAAYPNPFNSSCRIEIPLKANDPGTLEIFDIQGNLIDKIESNQTSFLWQPDYTVASGVYQYVISTGSIVRNGKVLLVK